MVLFVDGVPYIVGSSVMESSIPDRCGRTYSKYTKLNDPVTLDDIHHSAPIFLLEIITTLNQNFID